MTVATDLRRDLVVATIPGVQQFIGESRSTGDVAASSRLVSELTAAMRTAVDGTAEVVLPADGETGLPNRVVVLTEPHAGVDLAQLMVERVHGAWKDRITALWPAGPPVPLPAVPGFPQVQWVVVPPLPGGYPAQWARAQEALAARKRTRTFPGYDDRMLQRVCGVSARWAAVGHLPGMRRVRRRRGEWLSLPALIKRADPAEGFPSTWSVATGPFRRELAARAAADTTVRTAAWELQNAVRGLRRFGVRFGAGALPGWQPGPDASEEQRWLAQVEGACLLPQTWSVAGLIVEHALARSDQARFAKAVETAAEKLRRLLEVAALPPPPSYLAVLAQDADRMGERLGAPPRTGEGMRAWHGAVSGALVDAAGRQRAVLETDDDGATLGRLVYAGGDDALGFAPVESAVSVAAAWNEAFRAAVAGGPDRPGLVPRATASTAVVFFHSSSPLQSAISEVQELLREAKEAGRPGFGVAVLRRGGERVRAVRRWSLGADVPAGTGAPAVLNELVAAMRGGLSGRLAQSLERDAGAFTSLSAPGRRGEIRRLALRHGATEAEASTAADALLALSDGDPGNGAAAAYRWAVVARFVAAEGR
ncbi:type III-B CRISPR-associated protein Cas10/Cmr2 [Micromonospora rosaria]|uniref:type III-B CRISPR-associated protein Cas10/Cmr2 n=1 Tax=Micromonospora rosaria TaxID=47874 RepID=UPI001470886E|nr:type III-B CRISPR-associated protein Cas10/Cmr2 [Micromonospora rosaria]